MRRGVSVIYCTVLTYGSNCSCRKLLGNWIFEPLVHLLSCSKFAGPVSLYYECLDYKMISSSQEKPQQWPNYTVAPIFFVISSNATSKKGLTWKNACFLCALIHLEEPKWRKIVEYTMCWWLWNNLLGMKSQSEEHDQHQSLPGVQSQIWRDLTQHRFTNPVWLFQLFLKLPLFYTYCVCVYRTEKTLAIKILFIMSWCLCSQSNVGALTFKAYARLCIKRNSVLFVVCKEYYVLRLASRLIYN